MWHFKAAAQGEIPTPALMIDLDVFETNLLRMADFLSEKKVSLRPHAKTHKSPFIAHKQIKLGAGGITCAKLGEAEVMVLAGIDNILIANQVVGDEKIARLAGLCRHAGIIVAVDDVQNVRNLAAAAMAHGATIGVLIEVDVGLGRSGTRSVEKTQELAKAVSVMEGLRFRGVMGYEGHCVFVENPEERRAACTKANAMLVSAADAIRRQGIEVGIVSAGGTGTYDVASACPGITEIEAGSYIFMDARYRRVQSLFKPALTLLTTVVSVSDEGRIVTDSGMKAVSSEFGMPEFMDIPGLSVCHLSEEHAILELKNPQGIDLKVGDKIRLLPSHCCTTINLHDVFWGMRGNRPEIMIPIAARGRSD